MAQAADHTLEILNDAYQALALAGDFATTSDPRGYVKAEQRLLDAAIDAGMDRDEVDLRGWVATALFNWFATPMREDDTCWLCPATATTTIAHYGHYVPVCDACAHQKAKVA